jgi:integrase
VHVVRVAVEVSGHVTLKPYPKSKAGRRTVPLPPFVVELLAVHPQQFSPGAHGLVFTTRTGEAVRRTTFRARVWKPSLHRAGLPTSLRFHDLRHSYATWLVSDGVPINDVARVLGHEQMSTTLDRHTHPSRDRDRRVLEAFADFSLTPIKEPRPDKCQGPS